MPMRGGGFVSGSGTDHSQQDAIFATRTDLVIGSAGSEDELASAGDNFATDDIGNFINITAGTGFTPGRYEILSVAAGVATVDRNAGTADSTSGTGNLGGAITYPTDAVWETMEPGNTVHIANDGTHATVNHDIAQAGTTTAPITVIGYNTSRGDNPVGRDRPLLTPGANNSRWGQHWIVKYLDVRTTNAFGLFVNTGSVAYFCRAVNDGGASSAEAIFPIGESAQAVFCEAINRTGNGFGLVTSQLYGCWAHDCLAGIAPGNNSSQVISFCLVDNCTTGISGGSGSGMRIANTTLYKGTDGVKFSGAASAGQLLNNIISDFTTGYNNTSDTFTFFSDYNIWNNTTERVNLTKGDNDSADLTDPGFTAPDKDFTDLVSDAASTSIVSSVARPFVQGTDEGLVIIITGGSGFTVGIYEIASIDGSGNATLLSGEDTGTGTTGGEFTIPEDRNFSVGGNAKAFGFPGKWGDDSATIGFLDAGAIQREEPAGGAGGGMPIVGGGGIVA